MSLFDIHYSDDGYSKSKFRDTKMQVTQKEKYFELCVAQLLQIYQTAKWK